MKKVAIFVVTIFIAAILGGVAVWKIKENQEASEVCEFKREMPELTKEDLPEQKNRPSASGKYTYTLLLSLDDKQSVELLYITNWATEAEYLLVITEDIIGSAIPTEYYSYIVKSEREQTIAEGEWVKIKGFYEADETFAGSMKKFALEYSVRGTIRPSEELEKKLFENFPQK